jgi:hypothetical protein
VLSDPDKPYGLVLLAVNIPNRFAEQHVRKPYTPDVFKSELIKWIHASETLKQLSKEGRDWCAAIKKINGAKVEELEVYSSVPHLRWPAVSR